MPALLAPKKLRLALNILPPDGASMQNTYATSPYLPQKLIFRVSVQSVEISDTSTPKCANGTTPREVETNGSCEKHRYSRSNFVIAASQR